MNAKQTHDADQWIAATRTLGGAARAMYQEAILGMPHDAAMAVTVAYVKGIMAGSMNQKPPESA